ncbi:hypothetical protein FXO38_08289 [Capsicum annuum]|nr:hypothetical protein FXO38_08289 [Capsicum annuum]KAF3675085.1 hypothetical protein FXO37_06070 [Capsicum annuum]
MSYIVGILSFLSRYHISGSALLTAMDQSSVDPPLDMASSHKDNKDQDGISQMLEQHEEVELGEMELEISSSKVNPMISSPDSTCWQIKQAWEPDMLFFDCVFYFLLLIWRTLLFGVTLVVLLLLLLIIIMIIKNLVLRDDMRFIEFYNLVFMQYNKKDDGFLELLKQKNIDTALGLKCVARILQKVHHTASHLLQSTLKRVIGQETSQAGSMVAFDHLRFDFNFCRPVLDKKLTEIEGLINQWIGDVIILEIKVMSLTDAKGVGAIAMFREKYGE